MESQLVVKNHELQAMYSSLVDVGTEDAGEAGKYPMLKLTSSMSKENILSNGKKATVGLLYHTELKQEFESVKANIVYIGRYYLPDFNTKEPKLTYVIGAVKQDDNTPFVMFVKGFSLQNVWDFMGEVTNIRNRFKIPMFALNITINVAQRPHEKFKNVDVYKLDITRDTEGLPTVEVDQERAKSLFALVDKFKEVVKMMTQQTEENDPYESQANKQVDPDEIPEF